MFIFFNRSGIDKQYLWRNCSEKVTFTCTAQTTAVFWGNEEFGEKTMHYTSLRSGGEFRAEVVSYQQNCLVSSLSFRATASLNGTKVTCTNRDRSSSQSLSLDIMSYILLIGFHVVDTCMEQRRELKLRSVLMV